MSIKGIRKIKDTHNRSLQLYASQQFSSHARNLLKVNIPKQINLYDSYASQIESSNIIESSKNIKKINPILRSQDYQNFIDKEINIAQFNRPIHSNKISNSLYSAIKSFSSRQQRNQLNSVRASSRKTNIHIDQIIENKQKGITKSNFILEYVVGKGGFGKVWRVKQKKTGKIYAMKQMLKIKVINKKSVSSIMNQKYLLEKLTHPFIVNMKYAFQDYQNLYLVMDYIQCGDLRYHIGNRRKFSQTQTKFFIVCILIALEYLHSNKIIHRDLKPQNLVVDKQGYVRITDMGISREYRLNNSSDTSGTPGYMSPQVICKTDHGLTADFFAVGVMGYQFMLGKRPYVGRNRQQIRDQILAKQVKIQQPPAGWSVQSVNFINKLIQRKPQNRLGYNGINEIKNHNWLKNVDWNLIKNKSFKSPFRPLTIQQDYKNYEQCISSDTEIQNLQECRLILKSKQAQQIFEGYEYNYLKKGGMNDDTKFLKPRQRGLFKKLQHL